MRAGGAVRTSSYASSSSLVITSRHRAPLIRLEYVNTY
uniref:Uncharacterized protein n=1 Tax=Arundo donax TaxID=35708 RepID=A0A0A8XXF7_ARUDO